MNFQGMNLFDTKNSHLRLFVFYLDRSTYILLISSNIYFSSTRVKNWIHNQNNLLNITTSSAFDEKFSIYTSRGKWFKNRLSDTYINPHQCNNKKRLWTIFSYHRSEAPIVHVHYLSTVFVKCSGRPKEKRENFRVTGSDDFLLQLRLCFCNSPLEPGGGRFPFRRVFPHHAVGCAGRGLRQARPRPLMHYYSEPLVSLWFYMPREYSTASPPRVPIVFSSRWRGFYSNAGKRCELAAVRSGVGLSAIRFRSALSDADGSIDVLLTFHPLLRVTFQRRETLTLEIDRSLMQPRLCLFYEHL